MKFDRLLYHLPEKDKDNKIIEKNHFLLQQLNLPYKDQGKVSFRRFMQMTLNMVNLNNLITPIIFHPKL